MKTTNINFIEPEFVSVSEVKRDKKLKTAAIIISVSFVIVTAVVVGLNFYFLNQLNAVKAEEQKLVEEIGSVQNKKKESLYYLVKDRLRQINKIIKERVALSSELAQIKKISELLTIKDFSISLKTAKLEIETKDYDRFSDFLANAAQYNIDRQSMIVGQTSFANGQYSISVSFNFL